jgi:YaiO family outer membrane protein
MNARLILFLISILFLGCLSAAGQDKGTAIPQGSSIPGLGGLPSNPNGAGYVEFGGSYSALNNGFNSWGDAYMRGVMGSEHNTFNLEITRQDRYGDSGWFYDLGWTHVFGPNWYAEVYGGISTGGFFLPKRRLDTFINRKVLPRKQLVLTAGYGYDKSKTVNAADRWTGGATYYFEHPFVVQGGVTWTVAQPGTILARSQYVAVTQGRVKEHYITVRAEVGREGYELVGPQTALFNFVIHKYSASWRQWIGPNWGINAAYDRESNIAFKRNGGTLGLFLDF